MATIHEHIIHFHQTQYHQPPAPDTSQHWPFLKTPFVLCATPQGGRPGSSLALSWLFPEPRSMCIRLQQPQTVLALRSTCYPLGPSRSNSSSSKKQRGLPDQSPGQQTSRRGRGIQVGVACHFPTKSCLLAMLAGGGSWEAESVFVYWPSPGEASSGVAEDARSQYTSRAGLGGRRKAASMQVLHLETLLSQCPLLVSGCPYQRQHGRRLGNGTFARVCQKTVSRTGLTW